MKQIDDDLKNKLLSATENVLEEFYNDKISRDTAKDVLEKLASCIEPFPELEVICDETNNSPSDIENGIMNITWQFKDK